MRFELVTTAQVAGGLCTTEPEWRFSIFAEPRFALLIVCAFVPHGAHGVVCHNQKP